MKDANAFSATFLKTLYKSQWPEYPTSLEAGRWSGPWQVEYRDCDERWHVLREGDVKSHAILELRESACLLAAVMPLAFQSSFYGVADEEDERGCALKSMMGDRGYSTIGHVRCYHDELLVPLHVAHGLLISPTSLAWLLSAAPPEVLTQAGDLVVQRMRAHA